MVKKLLKWFLIPLLLLTLTIGSLGYGPTEGPVREGPSREGPPYEGPVQPVPEEEPGPPPGSEVTFQGNDCLFQTNTVIW